MQESMMRSKMDLPPCFCRDTDVILQPISTLTETENAVEILPRREQRKLLQFLASRLEQPLTKKKTPSLHDLMKDGCGIVS